MQKEIYREPQMELKWFEVKDVIVTSGEAGPGGEDWELPIV